MHPFIRKKLPLFGPGIRLHFHVVYLETGSSGTAGTFTITTSIATGNRSYKIKVSFVECSNPSK